MTEDKVTLPGFFTILYFADVFTSLFAAMIWGDFPNTNTYMVALINSILLWVMFKIIVYLIIMMVFRYFNRYSKYSENLLTAITIIYGVVLLNNLAAVTMQIPICTGCDELYRSIENHRIEIIP